jgi:hypothetical protein
VSHYAKGPWGAWQHRGEWSRTLCANDKRQQEQRQWTEVIVNDFTDVEKGAPPILDQTGKPLDVTILSHVHVSSGGEEDSNCWMIGVEADMPVLLNMKGVTDDEAFFHHRKMPNVMRSRGHGQHAVELSRLLTLLRKYDVTYDPITDRTK